MKLYGHPMSTCTRKVLTTLAEKGAEAQFTLVDLAKGEHKAPEHLARHPFGVIPVLDDDGFELFESRAIVRYLDEKLPGAKLSPAEAKGRARMEQWISIEQSYFSPNAMGLVYQLMLGPMRGLPTDPAVVEKSREGAARTLDVAEKALSGRPFLAGDAFTLADVCWAPYVEYLFPIKHGDLVTSRPNVSAWWERVSSRPSVKKAFGK